MGASAGHPQGVAEEGERRQRKVEEVVAVEAAEVARWDARLAA